MATLRHWSTSAWRPAAQEVRELGRPESRSRTAATQITKATLAAIVAWYIAAVVIGSGAAWLAPVTAVLMVQSTVYRSVSEGVKRVAAVTAGVVLAATAGSLVGLNAFGLLLVVPLSLLFARLRWISAQGEYIAITAVLLLTFGVSTNEFFLVAYVRDTAVGCVIGAAVNALLFPPAYQRSAHAAVSGLATQTAELLRELAQGVRSSWSVEDVDEWQRRTEVLDAEAQAAQWALGWSREAQRWNPWTRRAAAYPAHRYQPALDTLWHVALEIRGLTRSMREAARGSPTDGHQDPTSSPDLRSVAPQLYDGGLGSLLEAVAEVIDAFGEDPVLHDGLGRQVTRSLEHAEELHRNLAWQVAAAGITDPEPLETTGSMLWLLRRILGHLRDLSDRSGLGDGRDAG